MKIKTEWIVAIPVVAFALLAIMIGEPTPTAPAVITHTENLNQSHDNQYMANCTCYTHTGNFTYSGTWPKPNQTLAIRFTSKLIKGLGLKMGDKVYIEEMGTYTVEDRIPDYQQADFDIFFSDHNECVKWGRQNLLVEKL